MSRGRPGTRRRLDPSPIEAFMEEMEPAGEFDLPALDRIMAFAYGNLKPLTDPECEWLKVGDAQG